MLQYINGYEGGLRRLRGPRATSWPTRYGERFTPPALLLERAVPAGSLRTAVA